MPYEKSDYPGRGVPVLIERLDRASESGDPRAIAESLEFAGRRRDLGSVAAMMNALHGELDALNVLIAEFIAEAERENHD